MEKQEHIVPINYVESAPDLEPLWGNWIFRDSVVIQAGEPGISKTTFNYSLAKAIVDNKEFLGVKPTAPNLKVLYLDWESSDSLIKSRMRVMGYPENVDSFYKCNENEATLAQVEQYIKDTKFKFDILFIDPIRMAFAMRDENDNAEASRQAKYLRKLASRYKCAVIAVHHSSKSEQLGTRKASGAYARTSLADITMNFELLGEGWPTNIFKLYIPKNRLIDDRFELFIQKEDEGRKFKVVPPPLGYSMNKEYEDATALYTSQAKILGILSSYVSKSPKDILGELGNAISRRQVHYNLNILMALGLVCCPTYGEYRKVNERKV